MRSNRRFLEYNSEKNLRNVFLNIKDASNKFSLPFSFVSLLYFILLIYFIEAHHHRARSMFHFRQILRKRHS